MIAACVMRTANRFLAGHPLWSVSALPRDARNTEVNRDQAVQVEPGISLSSGCWRAKITRMGHRIKDLARDIGFE
jgi:hypothetical protein